MTLSTTVSGISADHWAFWIVPKIFQDKHPTLIVVHTLEQAHQLKQQMRFMAPDTPCHIFPPWDCSPFDRLSPSHEIMGQRIELLCAAPFSGACIIITTAFALMQKVPPADKLKELFQHLQQDATYQRSILIDTLHKLGYERCSLVQQQGTFALRGSLIDIFPLNASRPVRLDFDGDRLETLFLFDPHSQRRLNPCGQFTLKPTSEAILSPEAISLFRESYRTYFPRTKLTDPLYAAISSSKAYPGMEQWLPLFYTELLPLEKALKVQNVIMAGSWSWEEQEQTVLNHYQQRLDALDRPLPLFEIPFNPLPPHLLYRTSKDMEMLCETLPTTLLTSFGSENTPSFLQSISAAHVASYVGEHSLQERIHALSTLAANKPVILTVEAADQVNVLQQRLQENLPAFSLAPLTNIQETTLLNPTKEIGIACIPLTEGVLEKDGLFFPARHVLGAKSLSSPFFSRKKRKALGAELPLEVGDYVVHKQHGIGQYAGLESLTINHLAHDYYLILYQNDDKLFVPVENADLLSRYGSAENGATLDRLGMGGWQQRQARVKQNLMIIADQLIQNMAQRLLIDAPIILKPQNYDIFCQRFEHVETPDQLQAMEEVFEDLEKGQPMDRLICADVGFGKTEIALRTAFAALRQGLQVAMIVPTTLLARQHFATFSSRLQGTGLRVAVLSRFVSSKNAQTLKEELQQGQVHMLISTHALFKRNFPFPHLGLVIIDEEHHFGVEQKEFLKNLYPQVHILTLSATPLPRTMQLALSSVRQMSLITTPPQARLPVKTIVMPFDRITITRAIQRELARQGQVFYVTPHIQDLSDLETFLEKEMPQVRRGVLHGQLPAATIRHTMEKFEEGELDLLLCTPIIESGIDRATVNTIIIHNAHEMGLAQLYQLRGRVGRRALQGFAYLTFPAGTILSTTAQQRLATLQSLQGLGDGFKIASHDMEIRGVGNILGAQQSGHIREVGVELYQQMLAQALEERQKSLPSKETPCDTIKVSLPISVALEESYVPDIQVRLSLYQDLARLKSMAGIEEASKELIDRFGPLPAAAKNLLDILKIKTLCRKLAIERLEAGPKGIKVIFAQNQFSYGPTLQTWTQQFPKITSWDTKSAQLTFQLKGTDSFTDQDWTQHAFKLCLKLHQLFHPPKNSEILG